MEDRLIVPHPHLGSEARRLSLRVREEAIGKTTESVRPKRVIAQRV
jgi:hypothetical protein